MSDDLKDLYQTITEKHQSKKRDITSSTVDVLQKSHPKSPIVLDFESELFGLKPEDVKKLPIQSVEMLQNALTNLVSKTKEDPMLRQALRRFINNSFTAIEKEVTGEDGKKIKKEGVEEDSDDVLEESTSFSYRDFLSQLSEATKAQKFNWKRILDIDERKINDPTFVSLLTTFGMEESLTRPQRQGVMLFIKKLAELAETNITIAQALTKLVRFENLQAPVGLGEGVSDSILKKTFTKDKEEMVKWTCPDCGAKNKDQKSETKLMCGKCKKTFKKKDLKESIDVDNISLLIEGIADSEVSPTSILLTFGIGANEGVKKDALAELLFAYDAKFMEKNAGKKLSWKTVEAAFAHNKNYLKQLFNYATQNPAQMKILAKKIADLTGKPEDDFKFESKGVNVFKSMLTEATVSYSKSESDLIKDGVEQGSTYEKIAKQLNRKFHKGETVRTVEGVRKQAKKLGCNTKACDEKDVKKKSNITESSEFKKILDTITSTKKNLVEDETSLTILESFEEHFESDYKLFLEGITTANTKFLPVNRTEMQKFVEYIKSINITDPIAITEPSPAQYIAVATKLYSLSNTDEVMSKIETDFPTVNTNIKLAKSNMTQAKENIQAIKKPDMNVESMLNKIVEKWNLNTQERKDLFAKRLFDSAPKVAEKIANKNWESLTQIFTKNPIQTFLNFITDEKVKISLTSILDSK